MSADEARVASKAVPIPTPETAHFWEGTKLGELRIQRCRPCGDAYFYPRPSCPVCGSLDVSWEVVLGRARLHTYLISHRAAPGFEAQTPASQKDALAGRLT